MNTYDIFVSHYNTETARDRYGRLEGFLLEIADRLDLRQDEWHCLRDCLNGTGYHQEIAMEPGGIEGNIEVIAALEPDRLRQWGVELRDLLNKIRPMTPLQRLALQYRIDWQFDLPPEAV